MFMKPQVVKGVFVRSEDGEWCPEHYAEGSFDEREEGFFARMSAPGYMDCTEWSGPFKTCEEAADDLYATHGEDDEVNADEWQAFLDDCKETP
jgi:hypothetical protein